MQLCGLENLQQKMKKKKKKSWDENGHRTTKDEVAEIEGVQLAYRDDRVIFKSYSAHLY